MLGQLLFHLRRSLLETRRAIRLRVDRGIDTTKLPYRAFGATAVMRKPSVAVANVMCTAQIDRRLDRDSTVKSRDAEAEAEAEAEAAGSGSLSMKVEAEAEAQF